MRWSPALLAVIACLGCSLSHADPDAPPESSRSATAPCPVERPRPPAEPTDPSVARLTPDLPVLAMASRVTVYDGPEALTSESISIQLDREGGDFVVLAKLAMHGLGDSSLDPYVPPHWNACACPVATHCACEVLESALVRHSSSVRAALVDAFLSEVAAEGLDSDSRPLVPSQSGDPYGHVAVWLPDALGPTHLSFRDEHHRWLVNGRPLAHPAAIHRAYEAMLDAIGARRWREDFHADLERQRRRP